MTHVADGRAAESAAADYLVRSGFEIVVRNWRTRMCEIDIVARKDTEVYFCEVKYRRTINQGRGLDYVTPQKLRQMEFAARTWVHHHAWRGDYRLCAVEVSGSNFDVTAFVDDLF